MEKSPSLVDGARLEIVYTFMRIEGSNPSFSAINLRSQAISSNKIYKILIIVIISVK